MKKRISDYHRKNLELLHHSNLHSGIMLASAALMTIVLGSIATWQVLITIENIWVGVLMFIGTFGLGAILTFYAILNLREAEKIEKVLGVEETVVKYLESKKKASTK